MNQLFAFIGRIILLSKITNLNLMFVYLIKYEFIVDWVFMNINDIIQF